MSMDIWYRILDSCDLELKGELFNWRIGYLKNTENEYIADWSCRYGAQRWAFLYIIVMEEQGHPPEKLAKYESVVG